ncbi:MAG: hypothetical protein AAF598_15390 [Bacteroidota bacterium]
MTLYLAERVQLSRSLSALFFVLSTALLIFNTGPAVGVLNSFIVWMVLASLVLLFAPFPKIRLLHLVLLSGILILIEFSL